MTTIILLAPPPTSPTVVVDVTYSNAVTEVMDGALAAVGNRATRAKKPYLTAEEYPALARIWDNEEDDIFDTL
ncbi:MAG: hypothetical protein IIA01_08625 [Proteobacteria bacterium]|nr:hypothetical protein [Pseudomonadota bacterium]